MLLQAKRYVLSTSQLALRHSVVTSSNRRAAVAHCRIPSASTAFSSQALAEPSYSYGKRKKKRRNKPYSYEDELRTNFAPKSQRKKKKKKDSYFTVEPPQYGANGRPVLLSLTQTPELADFLSRHEITERTVRNKFSNLCDKLWFQRHETEFVGEGPANSPHFFIAATRLTVKNISLLKITPPRDALNITNDSFDLLHTGYGTSKRKANEMSAIDAMWQLNTECGIDFNDVPSIKNMMEMENKRKQQAQWDRAGMLLDLLKSPGFRRPFFETAPHDRKGQFTCTLQTVIGFQRHRLSLTGPPASSIKAAEKMAVLHAAGEPLRDAVGHTTVQSLERLLEQAPAQHMSQLLVDPLPEKALQLLRDTLGSAEEAKERWAQIRAQQHEHEQALAAKLSASWQAKLQREQERFEALKSGSNAGSNNRELTMLQDRMLHEEQDRAMRPNDPLRAVRDALPIKAIRRTLLEALRDHPVVVVSGGTGSGKSTQCPQYILEDAIRSGNGPTTRIVVTQPRRIAAISVAERVADERGEALGNSVGYSVRHNKVPARPVGGCVEFCTTGVLLRRLQNDRTLTGISHVMIDEVHERDINTDFLLVLLKDLVTKRPDLRVVLMSATLDAESFSKYFAQDGHLGEVPFLSVPTKPRFPVETIHLEDIADEGEFPQEIQTMALKLLRAHDDQLEAELKFAEKKQNSGTTSFSDDDNENEAAHSMDDVVTARRVQSYRRLEVLREAVQQRRDAGLIPDFGGGRGPTQKERETIAVELVAELAVHVAQQELNQGRKGSVLCFLPGWDEIKAAMNVVGNRYRNLLIIPLHSTVPKEDQHKIFDPAPNGTIKVIFATNIAESSVTINDALAIVDSGLVREMNWDAESAMSTMETIPTSQASATQRKGRAGRVAPGKCYRIYSSGAFHAMPERGMPEMQRAGLESTCLQACNMTTGGVHSFLSRAMDPPPDETVVHALEHLNMIGAIRSDNESGESLTGLGRLLSLLPVDPSIGRMLVFGCVMQCLDPVLTAAACFSSRDPFYSPAGMRDEAKAKRQHFCRNSDLIATVRAYEQYQEKHSELGWDGSLQWAQSNYVSPASINRIRTARSQFLQELCRVGLVPDSDLDPRSRRSKTLLNGASVNRHRDNERLSTGVWATGLPRNLATRKHMGNFGTLQTRTRPDTGIHPSSVAFHRSPPQDKRTLPDWFLYHEMIHSSQVYVRNVTATIPEQIMLFGGLNLQRVEDIHKEMSYSLPGNMVLDGWVLVRSKCNNTIDVLEAARREIDAAVVLKVMNPKNVLPEASQSAVDAVARTFKIMDGTDDEWDKSRPIW